MKASNTGGHWLFFIIISLNELEKDCKGEERGYTKIHCKNNCEIKFVLFFAAWHWSSGLGYICGNLY